MRLDRFLAKAGFGPRSDTRKLIKSGSVMVDNEVVLNPSMHIEGNPVHVNGELLEFKLFVYIMLNKPKGFVSARTDAKDPTVVELLTEYQHYDLSLAGRLDKDTTGLLILSNNGKLLHSIVHPKQDKEKVYLVTYKEVLSTEDVERLETGIELKDFTTKPARVEVLSEHKMRLTITEGKYHQIKRMLIALNNEVIELHREAIHGVTLDASLALGDYRELTEEEVKSLME